ncbi:MAG: immunoglobulin-like domain-containing protein [Cyclobacteriaceae bacterium]
MRHTYIPVLLLSFFAFMKCSENSSNPNTEEVNEDTITSMPQARDTDKSMPEAMITLSPDTFTQDSAQRTQLTVVNHTSDIIKFDSRFSIEKTNEGEWEKEGLPGNIIFTDVAYGLEPGEKKQLTIALSFDDQTYSPGQYRLCKKLSIEGKDTTVCAPFRVE